MNLAFAYLRERDIDILLVEELSINPDFAVWLCLRTGVSDRAAHIIGVQQSLNNKYDGETDIQVVFDCGGARKALLIENKISAQPMPDQAGRYRVRGELGVQRGLWAEFRTCLVAPQNYIDTVPAIGLFDQTVSYEAIAGFFDQRGDVPRFRFKASLLREAIEQNRRGYTTEYCDAVTGFVAAYTDLANAEIPHLGVEPKRRRPAESHWIKFQPPPYPKKVYLQHQLVQGKAKLFFAGDKDRLLEIQGALKQHLEPGMVMRWTAASSTVEMDVPHMSPQRDTLAEREADVRTAWRALERLDRLFRTLPPATSSAAADPAPDLPR